MELAPKEIGYNPSGMVKLCRRDLDRGSGGFLGRTLREGRLDPGFRFRRKGTMSDGSTILGNVRQHLLPGDLSEQNEQHRCSWLQLSGKVFHEWIRDSEIGHLSGHRSGRRANNGAGGHAQQGLHK